MDRTETKQEDEQNREMNWPQFHRRSILGQRITLRAGHTKLCTGLHNSNQADTLKSDSLHRQTWVWGTKSPDIRARSLLFTAHSCTPAFCGKSGPKEHHQLIVISFNTFAFLVHLAKKNSRNFILIWDAGSMLSGFSCTAG